MLIQKFALLHWWWWWVIWSWCQILGMQPRPLVPVTIPTQPSPAHHQLNKTQTQMETRDGRWGEEAVTVWTK